MYELNASGESTAAPVDFGELARAENVEIAAVAIDSVRNLLYVLTKRDGSFVATLNPDSGRRVSIFYRIEQLDGLTIAFADMVLGRLLVIGEAPGRRPLLWQGTLGVNFSELQDATVNMTFKSTRSGSSPKNNFDP